MGCGWVLPDIPEFGGLEWNGIWNSGQRPSAGTSKVIQRQFGGLGYASPADPWNWQAW